MASYNRVILMGNLTRDPQLKYLPSQTPVAEFGLAINRKFRAATGEDREEVCFVDVSAFGKTAELINTYFQKGKPILVEGRLKYDTWEDKQGGGKRSKLTVVAESFQFVGGRDGGGSPGADEGGAEQSSAPAARPPMRQTPRPPAGAARPAQGRPSAAPSQPPPPEPPFGDEQQFKDEDIPF